MGVAFYIKGGKRKAHQLRQLDPGRSAVGPGAFAGLQLHASTQVRLGKARLKPTCGVERE